MPELKFGDIYIADLSRSLYYPKTSIAPLIYLSTKLETDGSKTYSFCAVGKRPKEKAGKPFIPIEKHSYLRKGSAIYPTQTVSFSDKSAIILKAGSIDDENIKSKIIAITEAAKKKESHAIIMALCPRCRAEFLLNPETKIRRFDQCSSQKYQCDFCQTRDGYIYVIEERIFGGVKK